MERFTVIQWHSHKQKQTKTTQSSKQIKRRKRICIVTTATTTNTHTHTTTKKLLSPFQSCAPSSSCSTRSFPPNCVKKDRSLVERAGEQRRINCRSSSSSLQEPCEWLPKKKPRIVQFFASPRSPSLQQLQERVLRRSRARGTNQKNTTTRNLSRESDFCLRELR